METETNDHLYYMLCADMPHLVKIGITVAPYHRLKEANKHHTYLPPSGYVYGRLVRVNNALFYETQLKHVFSEHRQKNPQGNCSEFFKLNREVVDVEFNNVPGIEVDIHQFDKAAEKKEMGLLRAYLKRSVAENKPCHYCENPKQPGTKCHARYEAYKVALDLKSALELGSTKEDIVYDYMAGFLTILASVSL